MLNTRGENILKFTKNFMENCFSASSISLVLWGHFVSVLHDDYFCFNN